jgi:hypothetical protein
VRKLLLAFLLLSTAAVATTFKLQPVEEQLSEADGVLVGHYLRSQVVKLDEGQIATQMIFKINREYGLQSDWFGQDEVIIHYPGGKFEDLHVRVDGVPQFVGGEKVALLIKAVDNRYWGLNLGLGSFKIINYGKESMLVNSIFPTEGQVSQIRLEDFEGMVKRIKKSGLKTVLVPIDMLPAHPSVHKPRPLLSQGPLVGNKRAIASVEKAEENNDDQSSSSNSWLITVLALLGVLYRLSRQKGAG